MTRGEINHLISFLQKKDWLVYGPTEKGDWEEIAMELIENPADLILDDRLPFFSFKRFFVPEKEILFHYKNNNFKTPQATNQKTAVMGINILDLNSVNLYDQVFEKDPYYQERKSNLLVIGHSFVPPIENNFFEEKYAEDVLEHLPFDIFLVSVNPDKFVIFSGSDKGKTILENFGYKNFQHIQFSGPVREQGNKRMEQMRERMANHHNPSIWNKLGETCLDCGKCTIVCPTCFCFRIDDQPDLLSKSAGREKNQGLRQRCWDSCFYQEFSEVAGPSTGSGQAPKFLNSTAKKIHFWYYHKFVRIPDEYNILGCVGCGRCYIVCPVRINIKKILKEI